MKVLTFLVASLWVAQPAFAEPLRVNIAADLPSVTVQTSDGPVEIMREQDPEHHLSEEWTLTGRDCPSFCVQPMVPVEGVTPIGELELLDALQDDDVIVVDSRTPDWFMTGTIPGSVNIPYNVAGERLAELGCEPDFDGTFDCDNAKEIALFCNGFWCGQSGAAMKVMIDQGYPVEKISYYRGGMQAWRLLGLTVVGGSAQ